MELKHKKIVLNVPKNKEIAHCRQSISPGKGHEMPMNNAQEGLRQDVDEVASCAGSVEIGLVSTLPGPRTWRNQHHIKIMLS